MAWGDYNNDGKLDLYQANVDFANMLLRNIGSGWDYGNHWLQVKLRGVESNRAGIGARFSFIAGLQDQDKFFEMAQLADWITKLDPHFVQVWLVQAWNMAYNISVKFKDYPDRWRWVQRGIELLRDEGLKYNRDEVLIYRELAWFFQHKMSTKLDDANMYNKQQWANEMAEVFGKKKPDLEELINPQNEDQRKRRELLITKFKMGSGRDEEGG